MDRRKSALTAILAVVVVSSTGVGIGAIGPGSVLPDTTDSAVAAPELEPGVAIEGNTSDDRPDAFVLDVTRGQRVTILLTTRAFVHDRGYGSVRVAGEPIPSDVPGERATISTGIRPNGSTATLSFVATHDGTVRVSFIAFISVDYLAYTLEATVSDHPAEPNDDVRNATRVEPDVLLTDHVRTGDTDFFAFEASEGEGVNVTFDRSSPLGVTAVRVYGPDDGVIDSRLVGGPYATTLDFIAETSGTYAVQVADVEHGDGNYSLGIRTADVEGDGQQPYGDGVPSLPTVVDASHYDEGGEGVAYHDSDAERHDDSGFRPAEGVDVESPSLGGTGDGSIGYVTEGEWVEYTVEAEPGTYELAVAVVTGREGQITGVVDGTRVGEVVTGTDGWYSFEVVTLGEFTIEEGGEHVLRIEWNGEPLNLDRVIVREP